MENEAEHDELRSTGISNTGDAITFDSSVTSERSLVLYTPYYRNHFHEIDLLGSGSYGKVFKARHKLDETDYAIKKIYIKYSNMRTSLKEVTTLAKLDHANIVTYKHAWVEPMMEHDQFSESSSSASSLSNDIENTDTKESLSESKILQAESKLLLYIQMALCTQSLRQWLNDRKEVSPVSIINTIGTQILSGLNYIHQLNIVHHDINPDNIFYSTRSDGLRIQLGDFGLACYSQKFDHSANIGTPIYAAPENTCCYKKDIYSFGIVLVELLFHTKTSMELVDLIEEIRKGFHKVPKEWWRILITSISKSPKKRLPAKKLLKYHQTVCFGQRQNWTNDNNSEMMELRHALQRMMHINRTCRQKNYKQKAIIDRLQAENKKKDETIMFLNRTLM